MIGLLVSQVICQLFVLAICSLGLELNPTVYFHSNFQEDEFCNMDYILNVEFHTCLKYFADTDAFDVMTFFRHANLCKLMENRNHGRAWEEPNYTMDSSRTILMHKYTKGNEILGTM